jgi:tRNA(Ile)-lysidine synthase
MAATALDLVLVARFADDMAAALGRPFSADDRVALAVSGGPDSMAMLALAAAAWPGRAIAATVDHQLRPDSAAEAAMVADYCHTISVPHATLRPDHPIERSNVQAGARTARYRLLEHWAVAHGARVLATAHHIDDQAETFLMRAARGSGVAGLAGIRARQRVEVQLRATGASMVFDAYPLDIVRPLLTWRRAELRALAQAQAVPFVDDPSNVDDRYDRTRMRALLAANPLLDPAQLARSADYVAEADAAIRAMEDWLWQDRRRVATGVDDPADRVWLDMTGLPRELKRRLSRAAIDGVRTLCGITRPAFSDATNIEPLLDALEAGRSATQAGIMVEPKRAIWRFSQAPARRSH